MNLQNATFYKLTDGNYPNFTCNKCGKPVKGTKFSPGWSVNFPLGDGSNETYGLTFCRAVCKTRFFRTPESTAFIKDGIKRALEAKKMMPHSPEIPEEFKEAAQKAFQDVFGEIVTLKEVTIDGQLMLVPKNKKDKS